MTPTQTAQLTDVEKQIEHAEQKLLLAMRVVNNLYARRAIMVQRFADENLEDAMVTGWEEAEKQANLHEGQQ